MTTNTIQTEQSAIQQYNSLKNWIKLSDFIKENSQFTNNQMRWLLLHRKKNGMNKCIRKIGKPIYINPDLFLNWVENNNQDFS
jgi:hypothetical protein